MHGQGLINPVWRQENGRVIAGTLLNGTLLIKTRQPDGSYLIDTIEPVNQEAA